MSKFKGLLVVMVAVLLLAACAPAARDITASEGLEWHQNEQQVVARGKTRRVLRRDEL